MLFSNDKKDSDSWAAAPPPWQGDDKYDMDPVDTRDARRRTSIAEGQVKHNRLGWVRLTVCLIVEAIALGELDLRAPSVELRLALLILDDRLP